MNPPRCTYSTRFWMDATLIEHRATTCAVCKRSIHQVGRLWPVKEWMVCEDCAERAIRNRASQRLVAAGGVEAPDPAANHSLRKTANG